MEYARLTTDEILHASEMMIEEFGAENSLEVIKDNLQVLVNDDLSGDQLNRIKSLKTECGITE
jgi:hypothetical protein